MTVQPAVAGFVTTYTSHTPYLTVAEWEAAPTAVDITTLFPNGTAAQNQRVLVDSIERASSWIDKICHQVLAATRDTHQGRYLVNRWGTVRIPLPRKPVLEVSAIQVGYRPSAMVALTSLADVSISPYGVIEVPVTTSALPMPPPGWGGIGVGSRPTVAVTYVNGFPNTTLTADATAGATSITVASSLGVYPGTTLTIYDTAAGTEQVTVASSFVAGSTTVPLATPTAFAHTATVSVSNLPPVVKEAAVLLTSALIQTRGDDAVILDSTDAPQRVQGGYGSNAEAEYLAAELLGDLVRVR